MKLLEKVNDDLFAIEQIYWSLQELFQIGKLERDLDHRPVQSNAASILSMHVLMHCRKMSAGVPESDSMYF